MQNDNSYEGGDRHCRFMTQSDKTNYDTSDKTF